MVIEAQFKTQGDPSKPLSPFEEERLLQECRRASSAWAALSAASRNRKIATLKSFLGWLRDQDLVSRDLGALLATPKVSQRLPHFISADEAIALIRSLQTRVENEPSSKRKMPVRDLALVALLYGGGLRVSEACELTWKQIENSGRLIRVRGKGGKERQIALPPLSAHALNQMRGGAGVYIWGETPLSSRLAYDIVRRAGTQAGLVKPLHPHALRHSFATHLLTSGANLRTLQELLGHESLQATERYTHLGIDQLARTMEKFHPLGDSAARRKK